MTSKKSPLEGSETQKLLAELQEQIFQGWKNVERMPKGGERWQVTTAALSNLQRYHDIIEELYPAAHSDAQKKAEAIAGGTEENDEQLPN